MQPWFQKHKRFNNTKLLGRSAV